MIVLRTMVETISKPRVVGKNHLNYQLTWWINLLSCVTWKFSFNPWNWKCTNNPIVLQWGFFWRKKKIFLLSEVHIHIVMQCHREVEFLSMKHSRHLIMINKKLIYGHVSRFIKKVRLMWIVIQYNTQNQTLNNRLNRSYTWLLMISHMHACMLQYRNSGYRQRISHILKYR